MEQRTIVIVRDDTHWQVSEGVLCTGPLSWDEMLGHVASMTIGTRASSSGLFGMLSREAYADERVERFRISLGKRSEDF